jgi:hypothetical protein
MIRRLTLSLLSLLLLPASFAVAQTDYPLPSTVVDYINYNGAYANLFADDIPVTINGVPYYVSFTMHTDGTGTCISSCNIAFWNLNTNQVDNVTYTGGLSTLQPKANTVASGTFSGAWNGTFTLNLIRKVQTPPCSRYGCRAYYVQQNSSLTVQ